MISYLLLLDSGSVWASTERDCWHGERHTLVLFMTPLATLALMTNSSSSISRIVCSSLNWLHKKKNTASFIYPGKAHVHTFGRLKKAHEPFSSLGLHSIVVQAAIEVREQVSAPSLIPIRLNWELILFVSDEGTSCLRHDAIISHPGCSTRRDNTSLQLAGGQRMGSHSEGSWSHLWRMATIVDGGIDVRQIN